MVDIIAFSAILISCVLFLRFLLNISINKKQRIELAEKRRILKERLAEVHKELELLSALSKQLMPLKEDMDRLGANINGRHAVVKVSEWPEQHAFGITECAGFILDWK